MYSVVVIATAKHIINEFNSLKIAEESGFVIKEVVKSEREALDTMPDIIICPVKSESVDGQGMTVKIKDSNANTKVILYGRKTYESVKLAIDCGADGYFALPPEKHELEYMLEKMKYKLDKNKKNKKITVALDVGERRIEYFTDILKNKFSQSEAYEKYYELGFDLEYETACITFAKIKIEHLNEYAIKGWKYGKDTLANAVKNLIERVDERLYAVVLNYSEEEFYTVIITRDSLVAREYTKDVKTNIFEVMGLDATGEIVASYRGFDELIKEENKQSIYDAFGISDEVLTDLSETEESVKTVSKAKNYISRTYMQEIGLTDVAEKVGLSSAYFSRLFKQETGENFIDYLVKIRMDKAKNLLENTSLSTKEIGESVGYKKGKYFGKLFKNYTGYTPTEYKAKVHRKK